MRRGELPLIGMHVRYGLDKDQPAAPLSLLASSHDLRPRIVQAGSASEGRPLLVVAGTDRAEPDLEFLPSNLVCVAFAQKRAHGGELPDLAKDGVAVPAPDVVSVCGDKGVALRVGETESGSLESGDEVNLSRASTDLVPVGEHHAVPIAE